MGCLTESIDRITKCGCRRLAALAVIAASFAVETAAGQVVITEIMHSPGGADPLWEWIEVRNATGEPIDLEGWILDDDDESSLAHGYITSNDGTGNTILPAHGTAVLYAGDSLDFQPERFSAAWGSDVRLIAVDGFTALTASDVVGLWSSLSSYLADDIFWAEASPYRTFNHAVSAVDYSTGFPTAAEGRSIAWNGTGSPTDGANWVASRPGVLNTVTSKQTTVAESQINSTDDLGNPGELPEGPAAAGLLITEIMYAPASPLAAVEYNESDFEWVEIFNHTANAINFATKPHVFDDEDGSKLSAANLRSGSLAPGEVGILYNKGEIMLADMQAMWGEGIKFLPVDNWPQLDNGTGGDLVAIWPSYSAYNTEPTTGAGRTHQNAIAAVEYDTRASADWPAVNNRSSIWLTNLSGDPNDPANWTRSGDGSDTLSTNAAPIFDTAIDHVGGDVGSPGWSPAVVTGLTGDHNGDGSVDAADYVVWRRDAGTASAYEAWLANFGAMLAGGGSSDIGRSLPEPCATVSWALAVAIRLASPRRSPRAPRSRLQPVAK